MTYKPKFYSDAELHGQRPFCTDTILQINDQFRKFWGAACLVSPVPGAVARFGAPKSKSQHSVDFWGDCNATDLFPTGLNPNDLDQWFRVLECARRAGASGVGLYPQARAGRHQGMVHLDGRHIRSGEDNTPESPAKWVAFRKRIGSGWSYKGVSELENRIEKGVRF